MEEELDREREEKGRRRRRGFKSQGTWSQAVNGVK